MSITIVEQNARKKADLIVEGQYSRALENCVSSRLPESASVPPVIDSARISRIVTAQPGTSTDWPRSTAFIA